MPVRRQDGVIRHSLFSPHAFDNLHGFKMAHNRADIDFIGCVGKTQSASFPSYAGQESAFDKRGNDFSSNDFFEML